MAVRKRKQRGVEERLVFPESAVRERPALEGDETESRCNLPKPVTSFVGRGALLERVSDALDGRHRLLTLVGGAGSGKTRLAVTALRAELGRRLARHPGGIWHCDLTEARNLGDVCSVVAAAAHIPLSGESSDSVAALGRAFACRGPTLLVLDNVEHLRQLLRGALEEWLAGVPTLRFLVTSRLRLDMDEELRIDVPRMQLPSRGAAEGPCEAEQLFIERAALVRNGYSPTDEVERLAVRHIVERLDGVPLAIELAASRMRVLSAEQIAAHMSQRFELLARPDAPDDPRHGTLRGAIAWSWRLLSEAERDALSQCSVFHGGFNLDAAHEVVALDPSAPWVLDVVQSLCEKSLVESYPAFDGSGLRYRLLESVRAFASEKLDEDGRRAEVEARHDDYFTELAIAAHRAAVGRGAQVALSALARDFDNLLAVHRRAVQEPDAHAGPRACWIAVAVTPLLLARGPHGSLLELIDAALGVSDDVPPSLEARVRMARARAAVELGQADEARRDRERSVELAGSAGDAELEGRSLAELALSALDGGELNRADALHQRALELHGRAGDRAFEGRTLGMRASALAMRGKLEEAHACYQRALTLLREHGAPPLEGIVLGNLGRLEHDLGRRSDARELYRRALSLLEGIGDRRHIANITLNLGTVALELDEIDDAEQHYRAALAIYQQIGSRRGQGLAYALLAQCAEARGELEPARSFSRAALDHIDAQAEPRIAALASCWRARIEADLDELQASSRYLEEGEQALASVEGGPSQVAALCRAHLELALSRRASRLGRFDASIEHHERARRTADAVGRASLDGCGVRSTDTRLALARLEEGLTAAGAPALATLPAPPPHARATLRISRCGRTFVLPDGTEVDLSTRRAPRLILQALADQYLSDPGRALSQTQLLEAGWPGERMFAQAGAGRVYTAIATLRRMGLKPYLSRRDDGYLLDPMVDVVRF